MPKAYEAMRDKFAEGAPVDSPKYDRAQARAASIYNAKHPNRPVTGKHKRKRAKVSSREAAETLERR
jgi:hypothetical protein